MTETKTREPLLFSSLEDEPAIENLPEPIPLTPEQIAAQAEADERDRQRRLEWAMILRALSDNSMAVTRAMHPWYRREGDREQQIERVLSSFRDGSFLIDRLGAAGVIDRDLVVVLLDLRRRLIGEYGDTPAAVMLIDRAVAAYQDFIRITGWTGNAALMVEAEFFGRDRPRAEFRDRYGRDGGEIRGLTVEEYINRLGQDLIPLAERCARVMREALAALETLRARPEPSGRAIKADRGYRQIRFAVRMAGIRPLLWPKALTEKHVAARRPHRRYLLESNLARLCRGCHGNGPGPLRRSDQSGSPNARAR
jgi:hypothetical protein